MTPDKLQSETAELLTELIRFDTVNPPGNERPAIEHLERYLSGAGFETEILAAEPDRPNLVATLDGEGDGPVLVLLGHSTRCSPTPPSGVTTRGRATSRTASCGAGEPWT